MTETQAQEIVDLVRAATADSWVDEKTISYFQAALGHLNFDHALNAVTIGIVTWRKFPSWADFKEGYRAQLRLAEASGEQRVDLPQKWGKKEKHPDWVHVWSWCRFLREPRTLRFFPQQDVPDPNECMTMDEYDGLHKEWIDAGSPKSENPIAMAR